MVTLYSNGCPKCLVLKSQLDEKKIEYNTSKNFTELFKRGFRGLPVLEINGVFLTFDEAIAQTIKGIE